ncbi:ribosomal protein S19 binding protein 1 [Corythoichthys intestinalis]|uniref:ribosomal protein S19 binding protein 1 n=1 Tax=Corythoichthys intestinalis TaxID=161448 RepID=UPI0025A52254|nr:ribosomal protein S19 binding protein 1 [Corythoichthys intestinalis]XP_061791840.1 active regulator of SIRT1-like [Nerophis lumbriciformis]
MSASLIRRGLELLSNDIKSENKAKKKVTTPSSAAAMAMVSTNRQGVTRQVKRLQGRLGQSKSKATVKDKRVKCALEEFKKKKGESQMKVNLKYFMRTSIKATDSDTKKIQNYNTGRQSRDRPKNLVAQKPKETKSVFTEEEFQQFQKEYFGRTVELNKNNSSQKH